MGAGMAGKEDLQTGAGGAGHGRRLFWDRVVFCPLWLGFSLACFLLFYWQSIERGGMYASDMLAYMLEMDGLESGYDFPYPLFFRLGGLFRPWLSAPLAISLALGLLQSGAVLALKAFWGPRLWAVLSGERQSPLPLPWAALAVNLLLMAPFVLSMLYVPGRQLPGLLGRYLGVWSPNPFHNGTYMAARPFAIAAFFAFCALWPEYERRWRWRPALVFGGFLFLATMTKPSFTFVFVPLAGLAMSWRLLRSGWRQWRPALALGLCFIPTFLALLYQFFGVFAPVEGVDRGLDFGFLTAWGQTCGNVPLAIVLAAAFPLAVYGLFWRELGRGGVFAWGGAFGLMGLLMMALLYEKGFRLIHMNFSWGYMYGLFFVFVAAIDKLWEKTWQWWNERRPGRMAALTLLWALLSAHVLLGLLYARGIWQGGAWH